MGHVISVRGSRAQVGFPAPTPLSHARPTVGSFLSMKAVDSTIVGVVTAVESDSGPHGYRAKAHVDLTGEIVRTADGSAQFRRGVTVFPAIGDAAEALSSDGLRVVYGSSASRTIRIGHIAQNRDVPALVDYDSLLSKHFAVVGSTGVGKSSGVAVILNAMMAADAGLRVLVLDSHNEYGRSFGERALVTGAGDLRLPFWMFNFEEMTDVIYGGRPAVPDEVDILAELIPLAKSHYQSYKVSGERPALARRTVRSGGFTADTPTPYLIQDLMALIDERMGKLENRASRMTHHRLLARIEAIKNDPRYGFMFENANVGGDTMASVLSRLFRLDGDGRQVTVLRLATLPGEAVDAVVCVTLRLAFEFGLWSDGALPLLIVCEEAHRYASADPSVGFAPARRSLSRIAKEGRKYGVHLGLVSQRPAELDPTIISQCSTLFAMRMTNEADQALLRSATSDIAAHLLDLVPGLGTGDVIGLGEAMPLSTRLHFETLPAARVPSSEMTVGRPETGSLGGDELVRTVIDRWRRATSGQSLVEEEAPALVPDAERPSILRAPASDHGPGAPTPLLQQARASILKR
ncbi:ATP-binding protein [Phreatobacter sp.]|uniref:ATP-binding protein n=1 Tax=Phreatobacter sp. TaxID=1966341 RepID=UPI003F711C89